jgi:hypothetical protein
MNRIFILFLAISSLSCSSFNPLEHPYSCKTNDDCKSDWVCDPVNLVCVPKDQDVYAYFDIKMKDISADTLPSDAEAGIDITPDTIQNEDIIDIPEDIPADGIPGDAEISEKHILKAGNLSISGQIMNSSSGRLLIGIINSTFSSGEMTSVEKGTKLFSGFLKIISSFTKSDE